ncbi:MAG: dihydrolipoyl dehydrogenase [Acidobacteria bacterium]|nr:MAG: dihydrolipoyl dehydrogenase [Acidobacteriota bacterium]
MVMGSLKQETELVVVGGGPGGYVAALRAADLGKEVLLVEEREAIGGVCLLEGCIPSKALIHVVEAARTAEDAGALGLRTEGASFDLDRLRAHVRKVVETLSRGTASLLRGRGVEVVRGRARFDGPRSLSLEHSDVAGIEFKEAIVATGSRPVVPPFGRDLGLWTSREALAVEEVPERLLVVGAGYIGLELGLVYAGLGAKVTVVEMLPQILTGMDPDLARVVARRCAKRFERILLDTRVENVERSGNRFRVAVKTSDGDETLECDRVLVAVGRRPNTDDLGLDKAGVKVRGDGFIEIDELCRTSAPHIMAIGDVTPGPMLAHRASRQGKVAAEVLAGEPAAFDNRAVPAVVFVEPEVAWVGLTESAAREAGREVVVGRFPLTALGRARTMGSTDGMAKILSEPGTGLVLGAGIVAPHASELIAEAALAIEMGATLEDIAATIHPHPTLSESLMEAAEVALGRAVHVAAPRKEGAARTP